jgi:hypothetical protein
MAALRGNKIVSVPLADAIAKNRTVDQETIDVASGILDKLTADKVAVEKVERRRTSGIGHLVSHLGCRRVATPVGGRDARLTAARDAARYKT